MDDLPRDKQIYSLGFLSATFQKPVPEVQAVLKAAGIGPALAINDVLHFTADAYLVVGRYAREATRDE